MFFAFVSHIRRKLVIKISTVLILPSCGFKYLTTEIFILPCANQQMSSQYSSSKKTNPLLKFDFGTTPFDGDERQAHQFIPFLQGQLGNHQLSFILDQENYPDPTISKHTLLLEEQHRQVTAQAADQYEEDTAKYRRAMPLYLAALEAIRRSPRSEVDRAAAEAALPIPPEPTLGCPQTPFTPSIEASIQKQRENIRRYDAAADHAIQIIKPFLSSRLLNSSTPLLNDPSKAVGPNFSVSGRGSKPNE